MSGDPKAFHNLEYLSIPSAFLEFLATAPVGSGICMCGDKMEDHSPHGDHAPVEMWDHSLKSWLDDIRALNTQGTLEGQALDTTRQHRDRYMELLNDLVDVIGVPKPTDAPEKLTGPDLIMVVLEAIESVKALRSATKLVLNKLDHPTACVNSLDANKLRKALGED